MPTAPYILRTVGLVGKFRPYRDRMTALSIGLKVFAGRSTTLISICQSEVLLIALISKVLLYEGNFELQIHRGFFNFSLCSSSDKMVKVWDAGTRQCVHTFYDHLDQVVICA